MYGNTISEIILFTSYTLNEDYMENFEGYPIRQLGCGPSRQNERVVKAVEEDNQSPFFLWDIALVRSRPTYH